MSAGLAGSAALVTGAARGIGRGIADALLGAGAATVVAIDRDWSGEAKSFERGGGIAVTADLAAVDGTELADRLLAEHGAFDRIVNNVGITTGERFGAMREEGFDRVARTNLRTPLFLTQRLTAELIARRMPGAVLFIGSLHSRINKGHPAYGATKAAVVALGRELAAELGPHSIRVNVLSPGWVATGAAANADDAYTRTLEARIPLGRRGTPADIAPVALALLDDEVSGYVTGADLSVDGGLALHSWLDDLPG